MRVAGRRPFGSVMIVALAASLAVAPAHSQSALDAAAGLANLLDGASSGMSPDDLMQVLEEGARAGQPMALWQLGTMYENGEGVQKDPARAFGYFSQIANDHADAAPRSVDADIVAQSFVKIGDYYREGLPGAGIAVDEDRSRRLIMHAATYFGDADAQYRVGELYLDKDGFGVNPLQSARWLSLAAQKGHPGAQARLGDMLFNGSGIAAQPVEGLMWLTVAHHRSKGTLDETWVADLLDAALSVASNEQRAEAVRLADGIEEDFLGL